MRWLRIQIRNWLSNHSLEDEAYVSLNSTPPSIVRARDRHELEGEPLRFNIFRANGGTVVQTYVYDRQRDRSNTQLHIVGHDQDLGECLSKIVTMESLRG
jgi:hypothetical protein